ncbi:MAG: autotransporter outer membrane beta-barrel domain-containing protein [Cetobacterium sp.]
MKREKLLLLTVLILGNKLYGKELPIKTIPEERIEKSAYEDVLRVVNKSIEPFGPKSEVDFVPVARVTSNEKDTEEYGKQGYYRSTGYQKASDLVEGGYGNLDENLKKELPTVGVGDTKRFYFGNGNRVKNIIFQRENEFKENIKKNREKGNEKYFLGGIYKKINNNVNQLGITMDEYYKELDEKPRGEVLKFLQKKLKEKNNIDTVIRGNDLYTVNGSEHWKVLWDMEAIRHRVSQYRDPEETVYTQIYTYIPSKSSGKNIGDMEYTKDGDILVEDTNKIKEDIRLDTGALNGSYSQDGNGKNIHEIIEKAKDKDPDKLSYYEKINPVERYVMDREKVKNNKMTEDEFNNKWVKPFVKGGEYERALGEYLKEITPIKKERELNTKREIEVKEEIAKLEKNSKMPKDYYKVAKDYTYKEINEDYLKTLKSPEEVELVKEYFHKIKEKNNLSDKEYELYEREEATEKKHGFSKNINDRDPNNRKWSDRVISEEALLKEVPTKKVEFRGKGRIDGIVDLGEGKNEITITEQFTGKYGTNIILGPYAQLKNVAKIKVGKAIGKKDKVSISGNHSLTLDIDKSVKNKEGQLIQHALRNSDRNIEFSGANILNIDDRNDFALELMASKIDEDSVVNMGRPLKTMVRSPKEIPGKDRYLESVITVDSDSIAHDIIDRGEVDRNGNSLIRVVLKNEIKGLDKIENEAYKSIKDGKQLGSLWETLTASNKSTTFGGLREEESLKELKMLTDQMTKQNIYSHLNKIVKDEIGVYTEVPFGLKNFSEKKEGAYGNGGYISNRNVEKNFKGNTNTAYGIYENSFGEKIRIGGIIGGGTTSFSEIKSDTLNVVTTDSKIKGQSIYLGTYMNYSYDEKLSFINGMGIQYGEYKIDRKLKNNYQSMKFKGKSNTNGANLYGGFIYNYPLKNEMTLGFKGIVSYSFINQNKITEDKGPLAMEVAKKNYNYLDGELGLNLSKKLYGKNTISQLSGGLYGIYGMYGYKNEDLVGRIEGSSSSFQILGKNNKKDAIKLALNYDVEKNNGITYGIEGDYLNNGQRDNITIGVKMGYRF